MLRTLTKKILQKEQVAPRSMDTPSLRGGEIFSTRKADAVVTPVLRTVRSMIEDMRVPRVPGSLNRLRLWLLRMEKGDRRDDRTPFYRSLSWSQILKQLKKLYSNRNSDFKHYAPGFEDVYQEVEDDQLESVGPKSMFLPWTLDGPEKLAAVMSDKPKKPEFNDEAWNKALAWISSWLPKGSVSTISLGEAIKGMGGNAKFALDTTTNSGFPSWVREWYTTNPKKRTEARVLSQQYILEKARSLCEAAKQGHSYTDVPVGRLVGTASQRTVSKGMNPLKPKNGKLKSKRLVIATPKYTVVAGKTIMAPLQARLAMDVVNPTTNTSIILGWRTMPVIDKSVQIFLENAARHERTPLSGDISSFDASLPPWAMWDVANAMSDWLTPDAARLFLAIIHAEIYDMMVISPSGVVGPCPSSVKSGSIFTSLIGCGANAAIQKYGEYCGNYTIDVLHVMGDDFIMDGPGVCPEATEKTFADFGMEANASKQLFKPNCVHFLQRLHVLGTPGGIGSIARIGGGVLVVEDDTQIQYDERNEYSFIFQALARLENANFNPNYALLVDWVKQGDKRYHLGANLPPETIVKRAGSYAERKLMESINRPWTSTGMGVPFVNWSVNRVLRGVQAPPPGKERFKFVYGIDYDSLDVTKQL